MKEKSKKKPIKKIILVFIIFELVVTPILFSFLLFYGPFENAKKAVVARSYTSKSLTFLAEAFLSDAAIEQLVLGKDINDIINKSSLHKDIPGINIKPSHSKAITKWVIKDGLFGYALEIDDPTRIAVGYSRFMPVKGEAVSSIAKENNAEAAINAGGFRDQNWSGTGGVPLGPVVHNGKFVAGIPFDSAKRRELKTVIGFTEDGVLVVGKFYKREIVERKIKEAVSFEPKKGVDPTLIYEGKPTDLNFGYSPRTAIAQKKDGTVIFLVLDSQDITSSGATYDDLRRVFTQMGAYTAIALDGGHSTTMFLHGKTIHKASSQTTAERFVPTIFYVKP